MDLRHETNSFPRDSYIGFTGPPAKDEQLSPVFLVQILETDQNGEQGCFPATTRTQKSVAVIINRLTITECHVQ